MVLDFISDMGPRFPIQRDTRLKMLSSYILPLKEMLHLYGELRKTRFLNLPVRSEVYPSRAPNVKSP